jgi:hypothetical protein
MGFIITLVIGAFFFDLIAFEYLNLQPTIPASYPFKVGTCVFGQDACAYIVPITDTDVRLLDSCDRCLVDFPLDLGLLLAHDASGSDYVPENHQ